LVPPVGLFDYHHASEALGGGGIHVPNAKYKSELYEAIHSSASAMFRVGTIDKAEMRRFDENCLTCFPPMTPREIKRIWKSQRVSMKVFAQFLNTSQATVERWESGVQLPSGTALKLLAVVRKHGLEVLA